MLKTEYEELMIHKEEILGETVIFSHRADRIKSDGIQIGYFLMCCYPTSSRSTNIAHYYIEFLPYVNNTNKEELKFALSDVTEASLYRYLHKYSAILLQINSKQEIILKFEDKATAETVLERIQDCCSNSLDKSRKDLEKYQKMWINGWISNFDYLMLLNKLSNRSFKDISQYPIMPWILKQYGSSELDFDNPRVYRDLEKPIGALNDDKLEKFKSKYYEILKQNTDEHPYMYATHYSSTSIVLYYLIRKIPQNILRIQNTNFGPADRIFIDIEMCWNNCINVLSDVKELIPEFYSGNGEFLKNIHN